MARFSAQAIGGGEGLEPQWGILRERAGPPGDSERGSTFGCPGEGGWMEALLETLVEAVYIQGRSVRSAYDNTYLLVAATTV